MDGFPDDFKINLEVAMRQCIAHFVGESKRQVGMFVGELFVIALNVARGFADDLKIADDCILSF